MLAGAPAGCPGATAFPPRKRRSPGGAGTPPAPGEGGVLQQLAKRLLEAALDGPQWPPVLPGVASAVGGYATGVHQEEES